MKSFCIKTNNKNIINFLLKDLECSKIENIYFINRVFKNYENVIIHYTGSDIPQFINYLSDILTGCILYYYEPVLIRNNINYNYFYFDKIEKRIIENNCYNYIDSGENQDLKFRKDEIWISLVNFIKENKSMILDGFVWFRLGNYYNTIDEIVSYSVQQYVIEKEYSEFINLLQIYIDSKPPESNIIHLIYTNENSILLDENKNVINIVDNVFNAKYISDISFSSNDYALNALLTLLPKRIELHLIGVKDEFIETLKLIFGNRIYICKECNICKTYKMLENVNYIK